MNSSSIRPIYTLIFCLLLTYSPLLLIAQVLPEMPREWIETCMPETSQSITVCTSGCNYSNTQLQQAINIATPGTTILLQQGASYTGPYNLPEKSGEGWIIIRTAVADDHLPATNQRITPGYAPLLAKILAKPGLSAIQTTGQAHHYYFFGIEIAANDFSWNLVAIGTGEKMDEDLPHDFTFDRVYLHGHPTLGSRRGIAMNGHRIAVVNSWVSDFKEVGFDSQALCAWNGRTFKIVNNYLEGSGENIMFGGAKPSITGLLCADIEVRQNHFFKPLSWRVGDPSYAGTHWSVKNLFELKNAARVWVEGNIFENNWSDAQTGNAILFTPRTEAGSCPWISVQDVTFERNIIRHVGSGFNISGVDNSYPTDHTSRILLRNNLVEDINGSKWGGDGRALQVLNGVYHLTVDHNTFINPLGGTFANADGPNFPNTDFIYQNNIASNAVYGLHGSGKGIGNNALNFYFPGAVFTHNVLTDGSSSNGGIPSNYPANNYFPGSMANMAFVNYLGGLGGNYQLQAGSPYSGAGTDGMDIGADIIALNAATEGAISGIVNVCDASTFIDPFINTNGKPSIQLFPNPGNDLVHVTHPNAQSAKLEIMDLSGRTIAVATRPSVSGWQVDTSSLPGGIYFFSITSGLKTESLLWVCLNK